MTADDVRAHLATLGPLEAKCRRCGRCCHYKVYLEGQLYFTNLRCQHLGDHGCRVYPFRFTASKDCLPLVESIMARSYPVDCPYVVGLAGYEGPVVGKTAIAD